MREPRSRPTAFVPELLKALARRRMSAAEVEDSMSLSRNAAHSWLISLFEAGVLNRRPRKTERPIAGTQTFEYFVSTGFGGVRD